eukprot:11799-Heterococcus_DN1.PRE.2
MKLTMLAHCQYNSTEPWTAHSAHWGSAAVWETRSERFRRYGLQVPPPSAKARAGGVGALTLGESPDGTEACLSHEECSIAMYASTFVRGHVKLNDNSVIRPSAA